MTQLNYETIYQFNIIQFIIFYLNDTHQVKVKDRSTGSLVDSYRLRIGLRELKWDTKGVYINGKPIYFKGFGRHEDSIV